MDIRVAGENALIVYLEGGVNPATLDRVRRLTAALESRFPLEVVDLNPGYHSVVVVYDGRRTGFAELRNAIPTLDLDHDTGGEEGQSLRLPVYYAPESGPDLERLAAFRGLSTDQVVELHCGITYLVYAMGFAPGFAYLGEVDERIAAPRLATPRLDVPAGAVAIAGRQTAVYPCRSPGGWNLIGRCPVPMFDPEHSPPARCAVGDRVRFHPIGREEYLDLGGTL